MRTWQAPFPAFFVLMPEAAVEEDHLSTSGEDKVGLARQVLPVQPEAVTETVDQAPQGKLWCRILRLYPPHVLTAAVFAKLVHSNSYALTTSLGTPQTLPLTLLPDRLQKSILLLFCKLLIVSDVLTNLQRRCCIKIRLN